jgi:hypothetical protein
MMNSSCGYSYEEFQDAMSSELEAQRQARRRFKQLVRTTRQLFHIKHYEVQLPMAGPLVLRAYFITRYQLPPWSLVQRLAEDHLYPGTHRYLPGSCFLFSDYKLSTGINLWTRDGEQEYYFEVRLERPAYLPN